MHIAAATPVGGLSLATGYYPVIASDARTFTFNFGTNATSTATGGGTPNLANFVGPPRNIVIANNHFENTSAGPTSGLINTQGPNIIINNNSVMGGTYGAITLTSSRDYCATSPLPAVILATNGPAGSGIPNGTFGWVIGGDAVHAYEASFPPNIIDAPPTSEGVWTPILNFGGASDGITYTTQAGQYWKNDRSVRACGQIALSNKGTATGNALVSGFPFLNDALTPMLPVYVANMTGITFPAPVLTLSSPGAQLILNSNYSSTPITDANFQNISFLYFCGTYTTP